MSPSQRRRLGLILFIACGLTLSAGFILYALSQNINLFYTPSQLEDKPPLSNKIIRVGGMVVKGSVKRHQNLTVEFLITDYKKQLKITYQGILPDLFREGQGIVASGRLNQNRLIAEQVLAKHDEKYMPPEIANELKRVKQ